MTELPKTAGIPPAAFSTPITPVFVPQTSPQLTIQIVHIHLSIHDAPSSRVRVRASLRPGPCDPDSPLHSTKHLRWERLATHPGSIPKLGRYQLLYHPSHFCNQDQSRFVCLRNLNQSLLKRECLGHIGLVGSQLTLIKH